MKNTSDASSCLSSLNREPTARRSASNRFKHHLKGDGSVQQYKLLE